MKKTRIIAIFEQFWNFEVLNYSRILVFRPESMVEINRTFNFVLMPPNFGQILEA